MPSEKPWLCRGDRFDVDEFCFGDDTEFNNSGFG